MKKFILISIFGCISSVAFAQFDTAIAVVSNHFVKVVQTGDIDNDGDADILAKEDVGHDVFWYANDGKGKFSEGKFIYDLYDLGNTGVWHDFFAEVRDIDKSGKNDLICFSNGANIPFIFLNGNYSNLIKISIPINSELGEMRVGDIDKDNDLDIVLFYRYENIYWLENTGKINNWITHEIVDSGSGESGQLIDLNKDGYLDIVATPRSDFGQKILINNKKGGFTKTVIERDSFSAPVGIAAIDIEGDGDFDVVGGNDEYEGNLVIYRNTNGKYTREIIDDSMYRYESLVFYDIDMDGDQDIIGGCWMWEGTGNGCGLTLYENIKGKFVRKSTAGGSGMLKNNISVADINKDGMPDLVFSNAGYHRIYWMPNKSKAAKINGFSPTSGKVGTVITVKGTDLNKITGVKFNSAPVSFKLVSSTELTFQVPTNATSGFLTIVTVAGEFVFNQKFEVTPELKNPTNLEVVGSEAKILLTWTDNSSDEKGFIIERASENGSFYPIDTVGANTSTFEDKTIKSNESFKYRVCAYSNSIKGGYSNIVSGQIVTGVEDFVVSQIKVYPNPSPGVFNITLAGLESNKVQISVKSAVGSTVKVSKKELENSLIALDLSDSAAGMYFVLIHTGKKVYYKKIIKK